MMTHIALLYTMVPLCCDIILLLLLYPSLNKVEGGILFSHCPSVRPSVCEQNRVRAVSSTNNDNTRRIHFMFTHLIKQLQKVCRVYRFFFQNSKVWSFDSFFLICNFDFVLVWLGIQYGYLVWVIMGRQRYPQNAGVLVVLVLWGSMCNVKAYEMHRCIGHIYIFILYYSAYTASLCITPNISCIL